MKKNQFRSFKDARKFIQSLNLDTVTDWKKYCKSDKPNDIPSNPERVYANSGWNGIPDWLGNDNLSNKNRQYVTYEECQKFVKEHNITTIGDWETFCKSGKRPKEIPSKPQRVYKKQGKWINWGDFTGTYRIANQNKNFLPFDEARNIVHSLKFNSMIEFRTAAKENKLPKGITGAPWKIYEKEFAGWGDWLGTYRIANQNKNFLPIQKAKTEARRLAKELGIKTSREWVAAYKKGQIPSILPSDLFQVYGKRKLKK